MRTSRIDHSRMPPRAGWRDVAAAYLVMAGLKLAGQRMRHDIALHMAGMLRADVAARMADELRTATAQHRRDLAEHRPRAAQDVLDGARREGTWRTG